MVIFIHVTSYPITNLSIDSFSVKLLYPFQRLCGVAVYGFIFLSGVKLFLSNGEKADYKKYILSKLKKIYIPYVVVTIFYYFFEIKREYYIFNVKELISFILTGNGECHLYFVIIIMQFYFLLPLWKCLVKNKNIIWLILVLTFFINLLFVYKLPSILNSLFKMNFIFNDRVFSSYLFFWILGCITGKNYDLFKENLKKKKEIVIFLFMFFLFLDILMSYNIRAYGVFYSLMDFIHLVYVSIAVIFFFILCNTEIFKRIEKNKLFKSINDASYEIYLSHILFVYIINDIMFPLKVGEMKEYVIRFFFVYLFSICFSVLYKKILKFKYKAVD